MRVDLSSKGRTIGFGPISVSSILARSATYFANVVEVGDLLVVHIRSGIPLNNTMP